LFIAGEMKLKAGFAAFSRITSVFRHGGCPLAISIERRLGHDKKAKNEWTCSLMTYVIKTRSRT
jgi:hypothetical protein